MFIIHPITGIKKAQYFGFVLDSLFTLKIQSNEKTLSKPTRTRKPFNQNLENRAVTSRFLIASLALAFSSPVWASDLPDPGRTPGALNLGVTQDNIFQTVCVKGYTRTIRPPYYFTNKLKYQQIREYGYADKNSKHYEEDHIIALSIEVAPDDPRNLWPQPRNSEWDAAKKDQLEFVLYKMVCAREMKLADAQQAMGSNWIAAWKKYVPSHQNYRFKGGFE